LSDRSRQAHPGEEPVQTIAVRRDQQTGQFAHPQLPAHPQLRIANGLVTDREETPALVAARNEICDIGDDVSHAFPPVSPDV